MSVYAVLGRAFRGSLVLVLGMACASWSAEFETPIAITNVTLVPEPGQLVEGATILLDGGRIAAVGTEITIPSHAEVLDGTGLWAYAGFIDAASHVGITEKGPSAEEKARLLDQEQEVSQGPRTSMQKANRQGVWPHLNIYDLYEADESALEAYRKAGFTTALITPHPAIIAGKGDVVQLGGKAIRRSIVAPGVTQIFGMGAPFDRATFRQRGYPTSPMGVFALVRQTFLDAQWYRERHALYRRHPEAVERVAFDPVLDAMGDLLDRRALVIFLVNTPNEIHHALDLAAEFNQPIAILGGKEAWKVADRLAREGVPVIASLDWEKKPRLAPKKKKSKDVVTYTTASWTPEWEDDYFEPLAVRRERIREWEEQVNNVHVLMDAGVTVALTGRDLKNAKTLWTKARDALKLELTPEELLAALTTAPASIFGLQDRLGTVSEGKVGNLVLMTGPLEEKKSQVRYLFVDGERFTFRTTEKADKDDEEADGDEAEEGADVEESDSEETDPDADEEEEEEEEEESDEEPEDRHPWTSESADDRKMPMVTKGDVLLRGGTVLTVTQGTHEDTDILVVNGRIRAIGRGLEAPEDATVLDLRGYWVAPGLIDPHSHLAVTGINEGSQSISSEVRQADVVNHTQLGIHRALAGGVTTIHTMHGSANTMGGQNAVLKLRYNTSPREMLVTSGPRIVKFALGENVTRSRSRPRYPNSRMGVESVLRHAFNAAIEYEREWREYAEKLADGVVAEIPRRDLRLEAISDIMAGDIWVHSHCYRGDEMLRLLAVAEDYGFRIATLQHVLEGYRVAPEMYNHGVGGSTFSDWWSYKKEAYDAIPYNASMMMRAGIVTSLNSDSAEVIRHLNLEAGKMLRFGGLTADEAMRLITINPAIQIGLDRRIGSIEVGKDGDFAVYTGHPLDTFSKNVMTLIEGEVYFAYPGYAFDGTQPGPGLTSVPSPPRGPLGLEKLAGAKTYAITGATVHPVSAAAIENGTVIIAAGKIEAVGAGIDVPADATVIDARGLHVYPGLINAASQLGLVEISGIAQTVDARELAEFQPDLRTMSAVNPHSEHIPVSLCEGVTTTHVIPSGGIISGRSALIQLSGWTMPELLRDGETGLVMDLPSLPTTLDKEDRKKRIDEHRERVEDTEAFMRLAQHYAKVKATSEVPLATDIRLNAMVPYVRGEKTVFFRADTYKRILEAVNFAEVFGLKAAILGGGEAWKCAELLAEKEIPVIVTDVFTIPRSRFERFDAFYTNAAKLEEAGVLFCIATDGVQFARQLPIHAGFAVAHGLPEDAGLRSITIDAAKILGVDDEIGSLEVGKVADVIITTGNPMQAGTRTVGTFLAGRPVELSSLHERSYERFTARPGPELKPTGKLRGPPPMRIAPAERPDSD